MNKKYLVILIASMMLIPILSAGMVYAAVCTGSWIGTTEYTLSITNGQNADFKYAVTAITSLGGKYSIQLYRDGNSAPLYTYADNVATVGSGAEGNLAVTPAQYGNTAGNYHILISSVDKYGSFSTTLYLQVVNPVIPLTVSCTRNPASGTSLLNVQFTGTANGGSGTGYKYNWDYGDGSSSGSTTQNTISHSYSDGTYLSTVVITDSNNNQASASCGTVTVTKPITSITGSCYATTPTSGNSLLTVTLGTSISGGVGPYTYSWTFGDGATGNNQNTITHTYSTGTYNPTVRITDSQNNQATLSCGIINSIEPIKPLVASCGATPTNGNTPLDVNFNSQVSGGVGPYNYAWTFGDGTSVTNNQASPSHTYSNEGTFGTSLTVYDSMNHQVSANCGNIATVKPITPITITCSAYPTSGTVPLDVSFTTTTSGGSGSYTYKWNFGDNSANVNNANRIISYTYYNAGTYTTYVTVTDSKDNQATASCGTINTAKPVTPIVASCNANPSSGTSPLTVTLSTAVSGGTGSYTYSWTFGDGSTGGNYNSMSHVYTTGTYTPNVKITDSNNNQVSVNCNQVNVIKPITPITVSCNANTYSGTSPLNVVLTGSANGGVGNYNYKWTFGDGQSASTTQNQATHTYNDGTFAPTLTVTDSNNNQASASCGGTITATKPVIPLSVSCSANPTSGNTPLYVNFNSQVSGGSGIYTYRWTYGDGATGTNQNTATHTYTTAGKYNPSLKITDSQNNVITANCADSNGINVITPTPILNIDSITCFPRITDGKNQSCSVFVKSDGQIVGNANVNIYYLDGTPFGSCTTDRLSGGCEVKKEVHGIGTYTVYATANALGFVGDNDKNPKYTFEVFAQRYNVINLGTYNDSAFMHPDDTFYRGEALYAKFQVYDPVNNVFIADDIVTAAALVSLPGGRVDLSRISYSGNWYYYKLDAIPLNHDFLGGSNVFAFAFNFTGLTSGQAQVSLTILNNKPTISSIADVYVNIGQSYSVLLNNYGSDLEDHTLRWVITSTPSLFTANLMSGNVLSITGVTAGNESITLRGYDLDNDYADTMIRVHVIPKVIINNLTATCNVNPQNGIAPHNVNVSAQVRGGVGTYAYQYSFGDGTVVSLNQNFLAHTYTTAGTYSVSLIVTDSNNNRITANCGVVTVNNAPPVNYTLDVSCVAMPDTGVAPLNVMFTSVVNNGVGPYIYVNDYGMGYTTTSHDNIAYQTYNTPSIYNPTVHVTDSQGHFGNAICGLIIVNANNINNTVVANIGGPYSGYINEAVTFDASASTGNIVTYRWNFGDGTIVDSTTPTVQHTYTKINRYIVTLTVFGASGNSDSASTTATIIERTSYEAEVINDVPDRGIVIESVLLYGKYGEILKPNDELTATINLKNEWTSSLKNVRVTVSIPELGIEDRSSTFDFSRGSKHSETLTLPFYNVAPGVYYLKIEVHDDQGNDDVRRIIYREIVVKK